MKKLVLSLITALVLGASPSFAATTTYQVTGPVLAVTDTDITIQKGMEKWVISKGDADVPDTIQVGSKVTIQYAMVASTVVDKSTAIMNSETAAGTTSAATVNNSLNKSTMVAKPGMIH